jgi:hypothetical protein
MTTKVLCPNLACGKSSTGSAELIGRNVRCKHCGHLFVAQATVNARSGDTGESESRSAPPSTPLTASGEGRASIGRFVIRQKLGTGAFGTVYLAHDPQLDRAVALKVPNAGVLDNPRRIERFLREAKAAANLRHPHIVPVFDAGKDGEQYYIASAFIDGQPLSEVIEEKGMDFRRAARLAQQLADALAYAHQEGIIHRDVKPANCLVDSQDRLHLTDFGLAARTAEIEKLTNDGAILGTPSYMAPEVAVGQKGEAKPAADQYAVGVVLYEMLTGRTPFEGPPASVLYQVQNAVPESPRKIRPYTPRDIETVCLKAMAKRPEDRYADCRALADDLHRWLDGQPVQARRAGIAERAVRWSRREPRLALSLGAAVVGLALAAGVGVVSAIWLSASAAQLREANRDAVAAADLAHERELTANAAAEQAREAEKARENEAKAALNAKTLAQDAERRATQSAQKADMAKADADKKATAAEDALERERKARDELVKEEVLRRQFQQEAKEKDLANQMALANARVEAGDHAAAGVILDKVPVQFRSWEWRVLNEFAKTKGSPFVEMPLPVEKKSLFALRFSGDLKKVVVVDNLRSGDTQLIVHDLDNKAELFRTRAPGLTGIDDVQRTVLSKDGSYLAHVILISQGGVPYLNRLYLWDVGRKKLVTKEPIDLPIGHIVLAAAFHPKSDEITVAGVYGKNAETAAAWFTVRDATTGKVLVGSELPTLIGNLNGFGYSPDNDFFFSFRKQMYGVNPLSKPPAITKEDLRAIKGDLGGFLPFPPDRLLMWDEGIKVWGLTRHEVVRELADSSEVLWPNLTILEQGKRLVGFTLDKNNVVGLGSWSLANGKPTLALTRLGGFDETINPYEGKSRRPRVAAGPRDFAVSTDGDRIVYRHDRTVRLIRVPLK